jgi:vitamin B12 transporter
MFMSLFSSRSTASYRAAALRRGVSAILFLIAASAVANAVVVRGRVTDALGKPLPGARVQLVEGGKVEAFAYAGADGTYEIRDANSGRFTLLGFAQGYLPAIGQDFYSGATDVLQQDVVLATNSVRQDVSVAATGIPTPLPQLTAPVSVIPEEAFATRVGVVEEMRLTPGAFLVQTGQVGGVTSLFMRGGNSTANLVLIDGMPADDVGGTFDFGTVSSTAVGHMELYRGPDSAMYGTDAGASVIAVDTPRGFTLKPVLNYSGDAGNLHTWRNEVSLGGTLQRLDYYGTVSRFDTSNAVSLDRYHSLTSAINLGYDINGNTQVRFTIRDGNAVQGVPGPYDFQGVSSSGRQGDQDIYSGVTVENRYKGNWHNLLRYGIARKREQIDEFDNVGNYLAVDPGNYGSPGYVGNTVTIRGANGYSATGQVQLYNGSNDDQASNRDQLYYQSDYTVSKHFIGLFGFRYDNERGVFNDYDPQYAFVENEKVQRTNFEYNLQFQGEFWDRLFYSAGGAIEKNHLYGIAGTPRVGLTYVPVRSTGKFFHGTRLRANAATGVQEPTLALEFSSLYTELLADGYASVIAQQHIGPPNAERSRTYDVGVDQNILGEKLVLKAGYFHNMFDHQLEGVGGTALAAYFPQYANLPPAVLSNPYFTAYVNSLAFAAQGEETELTWEPKPRFLVRGGYTHLDTKVIQSYSSDAVAGNQGLANVNPNLPNSPIGIFGPLVGARPFRRAPNTGYFDAQYIRKKLSLGLKGAMASRSDDSTYLEDEDLNGGNTLLLPNRNLDFGYVKLDLGGTYAWKHGLTFFAQVDNLLNNQHIGPIGYPGLPLTFRTGLKFRLGGD